jgi:hypothetical protein
MKKLLLLPAFCLFFAFGAKADEFTDKYGIGTITLLLDSVTNLEMWESPDDKTPVHFFSLQRDPANGPQLIFDNLKHGIIPSWFEPMIIYVNSETSRLDFYCLEETPLYYKTNLKCESGKYIWIQKSKNIHFMPWFVFYHSVASVECISDTLAIFEKPTERSGRFNYIIPSTSRRVQIKPLEMKGDWMQVEAFEINEEGIESEKKSGWIRWRNEKEPLIKYNLMGC